MNAPFTSKEEIVKERGLSTAPREIIRATADLIGVLLIDNTNRHFKGQYKNEIVYCFARHHWVVILPYLLGFLAVVTSILASILLISAETLREIMGQGVYRLLAAVQIIIITYLIHAFFIRVFDFYLRILIITNFRLMSVNKTVFLKDIKDSIDLKDIQDIVVQKVGIFKTIFNYGEIVITVPSGSSRKVFRYIPNPSYFFKKINIVKRLYLARKPKAIEDGSY